MRGQGPLVAPATGAVALGVERLGQTRALHGDGRELRLAWRVRSKIFDPADAGQRADVRQIRRVKTFWRRARQKLFLAFRAAE